jgi:predicted glycoside hydrolase/deacetylase ChbG (UPF0249 family)
MKYLIVNGDDFGASRGINRGIIEAHRCGILTSTSLIVTTPWSEEAAFLSRATPALSVGLHVHLTQGGELHTGPIDGDSIQAELQRQFFRFQELMGRPPSHLDSHHNTHRDPRLLLHFLDLARQYGLPLREHSPVRYFSKFYGQWGGETHLEQIGVESLVRMLETEIQEGIAEMSCHPGYVDPDFSSSYSAERETELRTLCDSRTCQALARQSIQLVSFHGLGDVLASLPI